MGVSPEPERRPAVRAEDLVGTWRLRSWKNVGSDGSAIDALGENPVGYIFYNRDGFMSPNWIGNAQVRFAKLDGDLLTLHTKPMTFHGVQRRAELVWERVGHD
jgi:Lipocalin-like domain